MKLMETTVRINEVCHPDADYAHLKNIVFEVDLRGSDPDTLLLKNNPPILVQTEDVTLLTGELPTDMWGFDSKYLVEQLKKTV